MIFKCKPTSPGRRGKIIIKKKLCFYKKTNKLIIKINQQFGRNNQGKITTRHIGGGHKKKYRVIDFKRQKHYVIGTVKSIEYDPFRNAFINLISYSDGDYKYNIHLKDIKIGDKIISGSIVPIKTGNCLKLKYIPIGIKICCIESFPKKGFKFCRACGTYGTILSKKNKKCYVKINSSKIKKINYNCFAIIGEVGNKNFHLKKIGKAGSNRNKGVRPTVRGVAMNPVDHPHGGGEGKTSSKRHPVSPSGQLTKGYKTKRKNV